MGRQKMVTVLLYLVAYWLANGENLLPWSRMVAHEVVGRWYELGIIPFAKGKAIYYRGIPETTVFYLIFTLKMVLTNTIFFDIM